MDGRRVRGLQKKKRERNIGACCVADAGSRDRRHALGEAAGLACAFCPRRPELGVVSSVFRHADGACRVPACSHGRLDDLSARACSRATSWLARCRQAHTGAAGWLVVLAPTPSLPLTHCARPLVAISLCRSGGSRHRPAHACSRQISHEGALSSPPQKQQPHTPSSASTTATLWTRTAASFTWRVTTRGRCVLVSMVSGGV